MICRRVIFTKNENKGTIKFQPPYNKEKIVGGGSPH
jgi:hypothetical protein